VRGVARRADRPLHRLPAAGRATNTLSHSPTPPAALAHLRTQLAIAAPLTYVARDASLPPDVFAMQPRGPLLPPNPRASRSNRFGPPPTQADGIGAQPRPPGADVPPARRELKPDLLEAVQPIADRTADAPGAGTTCAVPGSRSGQRPSGGRGTPRRRRRAPGWSWPARAAPAPSDPPAAAAGSPRPPRPTPRTPALRARPPRQAAAAFTGAMLSRAAAPERIDAHQPANRAPKRPVRVATVSARPESRYIRGRSTADCRVGHAARRFCASGARRAVAARGVGGPLGRDVMAGARVRCRHRATSARRGPSAPRVRQPRARRHGRGRGRCQPSRARASPGRPRSAR
jgi:hypothetical protein